MTHPQVMKDLEKWEMAWGLGLQLVRRHDRVFVGHGGAMPGHLAFVAVNRKTKTGAAVLKNSGANASPSTVALDLATKTIEALPPEPEPWRPEEAPSPELEPLLGRWWTEGHEFVVSYRRGKLEARLVEAAEDEEPAVLRPDGDDRFRVESGREHGELVRVVRDEQGVPVRLYWATYACTRTPEVFGV